MLYFIMHSMILKKLTLDVKMKKTIFSQNINFITNNSISSLTLAEISGVKQPTLWRIANGVSKKTYESTKIKISEALNIGLDTLEKKLLNHDDLKHINISAQIESIFSWKANSEELIKLYKRYDQKLVRPVFFLLVDDKHASAMMPLNAKLEFKCDVACEDEVVAALNDQNDIALYKIKRVKRQYYIADFILSQQEINLPRENVLGVLKNIHF